MGHKISREQLRAAFLEAVAELYDELEEWHELHPDASYADMVEEARRRRQETASRLKSEEEHKEVTE